MNLDDMTRDQLKDEAKKRGLQKYHAWGKAKLIQEITKIDHEIGAIKELEQVRVEPQVANDANIKLSAQAIKWKEYFVKTGVTPQMFLQRYPNHKYKVFISELL